MSFWLVMLVVLGAAALFLALRRRRGADRASGAEWGDGSRNVGERWRTGGYGDGGGGGW
jgi:hypothetical protein